MWDDIFWLDVVDLFATQSHCKKKQVGAVFVKDNYLIATGVNGTIKGDDNNICECEATGKTEHHRVVHAEMNGIANAKNSADINGSTLYINYFPCADCAKHLIQFGVEKIVFRGVVKDLTTLDYVSRFILIEEVIERDNALCKINNLRS